jgi:hypothetical protein
MYIRFTPTTLALALSLALKILQYLTIQFTHHCILYELDTSHIFKLCVKIIPLVEFFDGRNDKEFFTVRLTCSALFLYQ